MLQLKADSADTAAEVPRAGRRSAFSVESAGSSSDITTQRNAREDNNDGEGRMSRHS